MYTREHLLFRLCESYTFPLIPCTFFFTYINSSSYILPWLADSISGSCCLLFPPVHNTVKLVAVLVRINAFSLCYLLFKKYISNYFFSIVWTYLQTEGSERAFILLSASQVRFSSLPPKDTQLFQATKNIYAEEHVILKFFFCLFKKKFPQSEERTDNERFSCQSLKQSKALRLFEQIWWVNYFFFLGVWWNLHAHFLFQYIATFLQTGSRQSVTCRNPVSLSCRTAQRGGLRGTWHSGGAGLPPEP